MAQVRRHDVMVRLAFALFMGIGVGVCTRSLYPAAWFAAVVVSQWLDTVVGAPFRDRTVSPTLWRQRAYAASVALSASVYASISIYAWNQGGEAGRLFALLTPAVSILNIALQMGAQPRALIGVCSPHAAVLLGLPAWAMVKGSSSAALPMFCVVMAAVVYVGHMVRAVRQVQAHADALGQAVGAAEGERRRAERASAAKSDFLAAISHEIRTPMNAVVAASGLLRRTSLSPSQAQHVDMLANASEVMMGLLNDVLDLSKIESGKLAISLADFALVDKLKASLGLWRDRARLKGVTLQFDPTDLPMHIVTDPLRFQQIVFNLVSNAVKFTDQGTITLRGGRGHSRDGYSLWIEVEDTGCGMDEASAVRVFDRFEQGDIGVTRAHGGTGLGLSISRQLAHLLGGSLTVSSKLGVGSTFRLTIPLTLAERPAAPPLARPAAPQCDGAGLQVLLAEDHAVNQQIVRMILEPLGIAVSVAANGAEAVEAASKQCFDVILMDMQMPVMGGIDAAMAIRGASGPNSATPILALTANALDEHRQQWAAVGVDVFLTKPIDMNALIIEVIGAAQGIQTQDADAPQGKAEAA